MRVEVEDNLVLSTSLDFMSDTFIHLQGSTRDMILFSCIAENGHRFRLMPICTYETSRFENKPAVGWIQTHLILGISVEYVTKCLRKAQLLPGFCLQKAPARF